MRRPHVLAALLSPVLGAACDFSFDHRVPADTRPVPTVQPRDLDAETLGDFDGGRAPTRLDRHSTTSSARDVPAISGGTLLTVAGSALVIAADPDRDRIVVADVDALRVTREIALNPGDQPGRSVELGESRVATVLRGAGALALYSPSSGEVERVAVCGEPRGVAYDAAIDATYVACMTGELVTLADRGTREVARRRVDLDLRDVWIEGDELRLTRFKTAEVIATDRAGVELARSTPPSLPLPRAAPADGGFGRPLERFTPTVAWRATPLAGGGAVLAHQRALADAVVPQPGGYGGSRSCGGGIVQSVLSVVDPSGLVRGGASLFDAVLPVDVAVSPDGARVAVALAGNGVSSAIQIFDRTALGSTPADGCASPIDNTAWGTDNEVVAVAFAQDGRVIAQLRDPASLRVGGGEIPLEGPSVADTGHAIFHMNAGAGIACASCHPEGREDGHVWHFVGIGERRTQALIGGLAGSEPFHWNGDMADLSALTHDVFSGRMSGPPLDAPQVEALGQWLERLPIPHRPVPEDLAAVERGRALFGRTDLACASCHGGERFQSSGTVFVGTGASLQVPSLRGVVYRAPLMHSGCAPDLAARFGPCGGGDRHGATSSLTPAEIRDLVSYMETL